MPWREEILAEGVRLILGDCLEVLPTLGPVDAVITDPPYGIDWKPRVNHKDQHEHWRDNIEFDPTPFLAVGRYHLFWGGQYYADRLPVSEGWLTWVKRPIDMDFSNDNRSYATTELAWRSWGKAKFMALVWDGGMRAGDPANRTFCHPSQKPIELMSWCIRHLPADASHILDPYMGSGTTGIAAVKAGKRFTGIELDPAYFDVACARIAKAIAEPDMFASPEPVAQQLSILDGDAA